MKDFYDIYYLSDIFDFDGKILEEATNSTLDHRNRELPVNVFSDIDDFRNNEFLLAQWRSFDPAKSKELSFTDVLERLMIFLEPVYQSILQGIEFDGKWSCESKRWQ